MRSNAFLVDIYDALDWTLSSRIFQLGSLTLANKPPILTWCRRLGDVLRVDGRTVVQALQIIQNDPPLHLSHTWVFCLLRGDYLPVIVGFRGRKHHE